MKCPTDNVDLVMSERSGVEIDYCPTCRGVWLDRGELDKIIEKSQAATPPQQASSRQPYQEPNYPQQQDKHGDQAGNGQGYPRKKRKESFLGDIFDF